MYFYDSKIELSYLAHLSCCVVSNAIRDYRRGIKRQPDNDYFMFIRGQIDDVHGQNAIDWFYDRNDSALSFPICCFLIERALSNKSVIANAIKHKKDGLLFDPAVLRKKIFEDPRRMLQIFKELAYKLGHEDVKSDNTGFDVDEGPEVFVSDRQDNVVPIELDLLFSDKAFCESDMSEDFGIAAVG